MEHILRDSSVKIVIASEIHHTVVSGVEGIRELSPLIIWEGTEVNSPTDISFGAILCKNLNIEPAKRKLDDRAIIVYTSGTTGKPKGAMLSYRNIFSNCEVSAERIGVTGKDRSIVFLPMFRSLTLTVGVTLFLYVGASIVLIKSLKRIFPSKCLQSPCFRGLFKKLVTTMLSKSHSMGL